MRIDVYDFDGTIYDGDSTFDFVRFCMRRHPAMLLGLPRIAGAGVKLAMKKIGLTEFKSALFSVMTAYMDLHTESGLFWLDGRTKKKLGKWFSKTPRDLPIVIASASPEFELRHAAKILGVKTLIGTRADVNTGELVLSAVIYPQLDKFENPHDHAKIEATVSEQVKKMNRKLVSYKQIRQLDFRYEPFEKTTSKKIKRHTVR